MRTMLYAAIMFLLVSSSMSAQTTSFTYQGRLTDATLPANGIYEMSFRLFDALTAGNQTGPTLDFTVASGNAVTVANGIFTVRLDFGVAGFPGADRFLGISVRPNSGASYTVLAPRQRLTASPYAVKSLSADTATSANTATTATNFNGNLTGDVTGTQTATLVSTVGGQTAASVGNAAAAVAAATSANTPNTLVRRDGTGNFSAGQITVADLTVSGSTGDGAVTLPTGSISATETLNEPGVAAAIAAAGNVAHDGTAETLLSRSITVPSSGYVMVTGTLEAMFAHTTGTTSATLYGISDTAGVFPANQGLFYSIPPNAPSGNYMSPVTVHGLFTVPTGSHTFYLLGDEVFGSAFFGNVQLTLLFVPTSYGTVTSTFAEPASGKSAVKPLKPAEKHTAEKVVMPKSVPETKTSKHLEAEIDELKKIVCSIKPDAPACKR